MRVREQRVCQESPKLRLVNAVHYLVDTYTDSKTSSLQEILRSGDTLTLREMEDSRAPRVKVTRKPERRLELDPSIRFSAYVTPYWLVAQRESTTLTR